MIRTQLMTVLVVVGLAGCGAYAEPEPLPQWHPASPGSDRGAPIAVPDALDAHPQTAEPRAATSEAADTMTHGAPSGGHQHAH